MLGFTLHVAVRAVAPQVGTATPERARPHAHLDPCLHLHGRARLAAVLSRLGDATSANQVGETVRTDVESFAAGAEPADDLAILVLRWIGPSASGR